MRNKKTDETRGSRQATSALAACALAALAMAAHAQAPAPAPSARQAPAPAAPVAPPPGTAPASGQPDATSAAYGDWVLQCQRDSAQAGAPICELRQTVLAEGQRPIAQLAIARLSAQSPLKLAVVLPTHVSFAEAPRLVAGEAGATVAPGAVAEATISLTWRRCLPIGCFADGDLSEAVARQWRALAQARTPAPTQAQTQLPSTAGRLVFQDGSSRPVALPVSMRGLGEALDALARQ